MPAAAGPILNTAIVAASLAHRPLEDIGLRTRDMVDQIRINGTANVSGDGGDDRGSIMLDDDECVCRVDIRSGDRIDNVAFTTNKQRSVGSGGTGGKPATLDNIRVPAIGGRSGPA